MPANAILEIGEATFPITEVKLECAATRKFSKSGQEFREVTVKVDDILQEIGHAWKRNPINSWWTLVSEPDLVNLSWRARLAPDATSSHNGKYTRIRLFSGDYVLCFGRADLMRGIPLFPWTTAYIQFCNFNRTKMLIYLPRDQLGLESPPPSPKPPASIDLSQVSNRLMIHEMRRRIKAGLLSFGEWEQLLDPMSVDQEREGILYRVARDAGKLVMKRKP
jgi:hypothetical protein